MIWYEKACDLDQGLGSKIYGLNGNMACAQNNNNNNVQIAFHKKQYKRLPQICHVFTSMQKIAI